MTKNEYNKIFDDATDELRKIPDSEEDKKRFIEHIDCYREENGNFKVEDLIAFAINEANFQAKDYLYILLQKLLNIEE